MHRALVGLALLTLALSGCGEDKGYGTPIEDPNAALSASAAVSNGGMLRADTSNDTALVALNGLSGNLNLLAGAKLQHEQGETPQNLAAAVDENCVVVDEGGVTYTDCEFAGNTVNGSVSRSGSDVSIDLEFFRLAEDLSTSIDVLGDVGITDVALTGYVDFDIGYDSDDFSATAGLDADFDVVLADGCAVGGELEVHATARAQGQSESLWVKAEFGPACGDVVVR